MSLVDHAKQKAGPLPVYGWVLIAGVGIAVFIWYSNRKSAASAASSDTSKGSGTGVSEDQYAAGEIAADYDLKNQLAQNRGTETRLATNIGKERTAEDKNREATNRNTRVTHRGNLLERKEIAEEKKEHTTKHHRPVKRHPPGKKHHPHLPVRTRNSD